MQTGTQGGVAAAGVSTFRLYLLSGMYLLIAVGLAVTVWPLILFAPAQAADSRTVVRAMLGALSLVSLLGVRYPIQMIPILMFELLWKTLWVAVFALPLLVRHQLDEAGWENLTACLMGVVLVPLVLPWGCVVERYLKAPGDRWRAREG